VWYPSAEAKYGGALIAPGPASPIATPLTSAAGPDHDAPPWHPDSPLFWFGLIAGAAVGLVAVSTTGRIGPVQAGVKIGDTK
jgi:hypothetical protein